MCHSLSMWNAVVGLDSKQLINNTKKPYTGASVDTIQRWFIEIFVNSVIGFCPHNCGVALKIKTNSQYSYG